MDNIIDFPRKSEREWLEIEKIIRKYLNEIPELSRKDVDYINERMKKFYLEVLDKKFNLKFKKPNNMPKSEADKVIEYTVEEFNEEIHNYTSRILNERLNLETRMCLNDYTFK